MAEASDDLSAFIPAKRAASDDLSAFMTPAKPAAAKPASDDLSAFIPAKPAAAKPASDDLSAFMGPKTVRTAPAKTAQPITPARPAAPVLPPLGTGSAPIREAIASRSLGAKADLDKMVAGVRAHPRSLANVPRVLGTAASYPLSAAGAAIGGPEDLIARPFARAWSKLTGQPDDPKALTDQFNLAAQFVGPAVLGEGARLVKAAGESATAEWLKGGPRFLQGLMAPASVSDVATEAAGAIRRGRGLNKLSADQAAHHLMAAQKATGAKPTAWHDELVGYIENRSQREKPPDQPEFAKADPSTAAGRARGKLQAKLFSDTDTQRAANIMRDIYTHWRDRATEVVRRNTGAAPQFIDDYFAHLWEDTPGKQKILDGMKDEYSLPPRQGTGVHLRRRAIPTMEEGIARGLTPKYPNAFEATNMYVQNMSRFLTTHEVQATLKEMGHAGFFFHSDAPEGWVQLDGILTDRLAPPEAVETKAAAAEPHPDPRLRIGGNYPPEGIEGPGERGVTPHVPDYPEYPQIGGRSVAQPRQPPGFEQVGAEARPRIGDPDMLNITPKPEEEGKPDEQRDVRPPPTQKLYAHPDAARVYNNWISKGLEADRTFGPTFKFLRTVKNATTQAKLSLSGFHAVTMANEAMISELSRAITTASRGQFKEAGKAFLRTPVAPVLKYAKGRAMTERMLKAGNPWEINEPVMRAFARSGQQIHQDDFFRTRGAGSFFQSLQRGSFGEDLTNALKKIGGAKSIPEFATHSFDLVGNVVQAVTAPLFEHIIPAMKVGTFGDEMGSWLQANPQASEEEIDRMAAKIGDSIDNRFGEMVQDNMFWHRNLQQIAQLALTSPSWDVGTAREILGGIKDIPESVKGLLTGKGVTHRFSYVAALAAMTTLGAEIYQRLKTGQDISSPLDVAGPKTGGVTPHGEPERAWGPGYQKDVYAFTLNPEGPGAELAAKRSGLAQTLGQLSTGKDWRELPLVRPFGVPDTGDDEDSRISAVAKYFADQVMPMSFEQQPKKGTRIGPFERFMGMRPAPAYIEERPRTVAGHTSREAKAWAAKRRADAIAKSQLEP